MKVLKEEMKVEALKLKEMKMVKLKVEKTNMKLLCKMLFLNVQKEEVIVGIVD